MRLALATLWIMVGCVLTATVYSQVFHFPFSNFDDPATQTGP